MTVTARDEFLAGDRPDHIALYLSEPLLSGDVRHLAEYGDRVEDGVVLIVDGERGRSLVGEFFGVDAMTFAREAMQRDGTIADDLTSGTCPEDTDEGHAVTLLLAFVEEQHEDVGGRYAEGPVVHAYAACRCGATYADRWTITP